MFRVAAILLCVVAYGEGFLFGSGQNWDDLKTTWGLNPFGSIDYHSQPRKEAEAVSQGFTKLSDCSDGSPFAGKRYVKGGDHAIILIYDVHGYIAGMQVGIPTQASGYPFSPLQNHPMIRVGNMWYLTAYFVDPASICSTGRQQSDYDHDGTGTDVFIQNGTNPARDSFQLPHEESDMAATRWVKGKCFPAMGDHYWYGISNDMNCERFFPVFALYNKGKLNAFGWALEADMSSPVMEHPPQSALSGFFQTESKPACLAQQKYLSTLHIYMTSTPALDLC